MKEGMVSQPKCPLKTVSEMITVSYVSLCGCGRECRAGTSWLTAAPSLHFLSSTLTAELSNQGSLALLEVSANMGSSCELESDLENTCLPY